MKQSMTILTTVGVLLAFSAAPSTAGIKPVYAIGDCLGALKQITVPRPAALTHLQGATGPGDGASFGQDHAGIEAAYFDYQDQTESGAYIYKLTGRTAQFSCTIASDLCPDPASLERATRWGEEGLAMVIAGQMPPLPPACRDAP